MFRLTTSWNSKGTRLRGGWHGTHAAWARSLSTIRCGPREARVEVSTYLDAIQAATYSDVILLAMRSDVLEGTVLRWEDRKSAVPASRHEGSKQRGFCTLYALSCQLSTLLTIRSFRVHFQLASMFIRTYIVANEGLFKRSCSSIIIYLWTFM